MKYFLHSWSKAAYTVLVRCCLCSHAQTISTRVDKSSAPRYALRYLSLNITKQTTNAPWAAAAHALSTQGIGLLIADAPTDMCQRPEASRSAVEMTAHIRAALQKLNKTFPGILVLDKNGLGRSAGQQRCLRTRMSIWGNLWLWGGKTALRKTLAFPQISRQVTNERCGAGGRRGCKPMLAEHGACKATNDETWRTVE